MDQSQTLSFVKKHTHTQWPVSQLEQEVRWQLLTARSVRQHPCLLSSHTQRNVSLKYSQNVRKWRLWVKKDGQMISIPSMRKVVPHARRNAWRNLLFRFQETVLSNRHYLKCQMGQARTNASTRDSALKIPRLFWNLQCSHYIKFCKKAQLAEHCCTEFHLCEKQVLVCTAKNEFHFPSCIHCSTTKHYA